MSKEEKFIENVKKVYRLLLLLFSLILVISGTAVYYMFDSDFSVFTSKSDMLVSIPIEENEDRIEHGIHVGTGLKDAEGLMTVVNNCTSCHSAKIVMQNRMTAERWNETIKWMQETQNLADLGGNQEIIVNYLVNNYPPLEKGRRENLVDIEWYELED